MIEVAPDCSNLDIKTFPKDQYLTKNIGVTEADESQNFLTIDQETPVIDIQVKRRQKRKKDDCLSKRLSVHEVNQILSLSLSILLAAMLQTVHCFTIYMNEHIKAFGV